MPKLPDASNLSGVNIGAPRSMVNMPVPDIAGATSAIARGISDLGQGVSVFADERRKKAAAQERFDTKMGLLRAEEAYAEATRDLDPLDPDYVNKVKRARIETFSPYLSAVKDPENRQYFDLTTGEDFVRIGIEADNQHRKARATKSVSDITDYVDGVVKGTRSGAYRGDPVADVNDIIDSNTWLSDAQKQELKRKAAGTVRLASIEKTAKTYYDKGIAVTPALKASIDRATASGSPSWMSDYLGRLATIESSGGTNLQTDLSTAAGPYAFIETTGKAYGLNTLQDRLDFDKSTDAVIRFTMDNYKTLEASLGRPPTQNELYLAHQQGAGGALQLLANPDASAASIVGEDAVINNGGWEGMTADQFTTLWDNKFAADDEVLDEDEAYATLSADPNFAELTSSEQDAAVKVLIQTGKERVKARQDEEKAQRDEIFREFVRLEANDELTQEWVDEQMAAGIVSARDLRSFQKAVDRQSGNLSDDPDAVSRLQSRVAGADTVESLMEVEAEIAQAYTDGEISRSTRSRLTSVIGPTKRILERQNKFYQRGKSAIFNVLRGDTFDFVDPAVLANNNEQAIAAFDNWLAANPNVDGVVAVEKATKIAKIIADDTSREARRSLPVPPALSGKNPFTVTREDIVRLAQSIERAGTDIPGGKAAYIAQVNLLRKWISVIQAEEALNDE